MNITVDQSTILDGLKVCGFVQPLKESVIVAASSEDQVLFVGRNLNVGSEVETWFDCPVEQPGSVTIPGERLHTLAANSKKGSSINLYTKDSSLMVSMGRLKGKLLTGAVVGDSRLSTRYGQLVFETAFESSTPIRGIIRKVTKPASTVDESMPFDGMLQIELLPKIGIIGRTTDGRRLAEARFEIDLGIEERSVWHVPGAALKVLAQIANESEETFTLGFASRFMVVSSGNIRYTASLSTKSLPDVSRVLVLPGPYFVVRTDARDLRGALSRLSATAESGDFPYVDVKFVPGELRLQAKGKGKGQLVEPVDANYKGPEILMRFTLAYLLDAFAGADLVDIAVKEPAGDKPFHIVIDHVDCPFKSRHVVMPQMIR